MPRRSPTPDFTVCDIWGIPRYTNQNEYPRSFDALIREHWQDLIDGHFCSKKQITDWAWRWEFLRRTQAYRHYWKKYKVQSARNDYYHPDFDFYGTLPDPRTRWTYEVPRVVSFRHLDNEDGVEAFAIDLKKPLKRQIDWVLEDAKLKQKQFFRVRSKIKRGKLKTFSQDLIKKYNADRNKWHKFLRAIDAKAANASNEDIARVVGIYSEEKEQSEISSHASQFLKSAYSHQQLIADLDSLEKATRAPVLIE